MGAVYAICGEYEIPNRKGKGFSLLRVGEDGMARPWHIFVVRWDKQFFADVNRCPHNGVHLDWERNQFVDATVKRIVCGKHGSLFDPATGACIEGKCAGQGLEPVAVCVLDGDVCVTGVKLAEED